MFRRLALSVLLVSSLLLVAAGGASTTVATDPCGDPTAEGDLVVVPWHDLCALSLSAIEVETSDGDVVTELTATLDVVSTDRTSPTMLRFGWAAGDCDVRVVLGDETPNQHAISALGAQCGEDAPFDDCVVRATLPTGEEPAVCKQGLRTTDIPSPAVTDTSYTWTIRLEGDLAELVGAHGRGTELVVASATAGPRLWEKSNSAVRAVCVRGHGPPETCVTSGGDVMWSEATVTVD